MIKVRQFSRSSDRQSLACAFRKRSGGFYIPGKHPANVGTYFGYIDEAEYISGIVAGLTTKSNKSCGYHASQAAIAPKGYLTGAEWDWSHVYGLYVAVMILTCSNKHSLSGTPGALADRT
jgi:hypothetical protein